MNYCRLGHEGGHLGHKAYYSFSCAYYPYAKFQRPRLPWGGAKTKRADFFGWVGRRGGVPGFSRPFFEGLKIHEGGPRPEGQW